MTFNILSLSSFKISRDKALESVDLLILTDSFYLLNIYFLRIIFVYYCNSVFFLYILILTIYKLNIIKDYCPFHFFLYKATLNLFDNTANFLRL